MKKNIQNEGISFLRALRILVISVDENVQDIFLYCFKILGRPYLQWLALRFDNQRDR